VERRNFLRGGTSALIGAPAAVRKARGEIRLLGLPAPRSFPEVVLFGFDDWAFPFRSNVEKHLFPASNPRMVLRHGPPGSHDEVLLYYGTVIRIGETLHMWYTGNYGPEANQIGYERVNCCVCYAHSGDGVKWEKPELGLVEFNGSRRNNIVDFPDHRMWSTCAVLHDPEEGDPARRFKMAYEADVGGKKRFCVAFSPDGFGWKPHRNNPVGPFLEMSGIARHGGLYYVSGQGEFTGTSPLGARRLVTFASADFETWSPCGAVGMDRAPDLVGPSGDDRQHQFEEIHLGAALWNRGNVLLGTYGQWHGHPSGDRRRVTMDLGLAISYDGLHYHEPIPNFRLVPAREQPESPANVEPALMQGQGMENLGNQTLYWYSLWRGAAGSGVRLVTWPRDRLGALKPYRPLDARAISCPFEIHDGSARVLVNASGLGPNSVLRVGLLDVGFRPVVGFGAADSITIGDNGFDMPVRWGSVERLPEQKVLRLDVQFGGVRPEDARLHAIYLRAS
jgi:hypothetical protein